MATPPCFRCTSILSGLILSAGTAAAGVRYVDDDADPGGDGQTWTSAYRFLQDALAEAGLPGSAVTEVRVAGGTYLPDRTSADPGGTGDREASFHMLSGVAVRGGYLGQSAGKGEDPDRRDLLLHPAVLSGDLAGNDESDDFGPLDDNALHVTTASGTDDAAVLDGVTVTAGNADGFGPDPTRTGGGMLNAGGAITIMDCRFLGNAAQACGGGGAHFGARPAIVRCLFQGNAAGGPGAAGGGLYFHEGDPVLIECSFIANTAQEKGGAISFTSFEPGAAGLVAGCHFSGNSAGSSGFFAVGGAVSVVGWLNTFVNCIFTGNSADSGWHGIGGAVAHGAWQVPPDGPFEGSSIIVNCLLIDNFARLAGGAVINGDLGRLRVANCTLSGNAAPGQFGGGGIYDVGGTLVENSVIWGNAPDGVAASVPSETVVRFCDVQGGFAGEGNISTDPRFVDPGAGDYRLASGSPAVDAGHNWLVPPDQADLDGDGDAGELTPLDLAGGPRFVHAPGPHPGCGVPAVVDMGAFEVPEGEPGVIRLGDVDGDGAVGSVDLVTLLASWGPCGAGCCLSDLDVDGAVGITDLLILLREWR